MTPKSGFLLVGTGIITLKGSINTANSEKLRYLLSKTMNNKKVLAYRLLESTNDLRIIFVRHIHFKKLVIKFQKFIEIFHCC